MKAVIALGAAALALAVYLPLLGHTELEREEPRRAVIARSMIETGDYLVPSFEGRPYAKKPPLYNWTVAAAGLARGRVDEIAARLPSVVSIALLGAFMVLAASSFLSPWGCAYLGAAVVLSPVVAEKARLAEIEPLFTLLVTASLWLWFDLSRRGRRGARQWWFPAAIAGLAFLTKREPGPLFFFLGAGGFLVAVGRGRELRSRGFAVALLVVAAVGLLWVIPLASRVGVEAFLETLRSEVLERGTGVSVAALVGHLIAYPLEVLISGAPFSLFLLALADGRVRRRLRRHYGAAYDFAVWSALVNFVPYWLRGDAAVRYFMPMLPTLLVLSAMVFERWALEQSSLLPSDLARLAKRTSRTAVPISGGLAALLGLSALLPSLLYRQSSPLPASVLVVIMAGLLAAGAAIARLAAERPRIGLVAVVVLAMLALRVSSFSFWIVEKAEHNEHVEQKMQRFASAVPAERWPALAVGPLPPAVWFYAPDGFLRPLIAAEDERRRASYFVYDDGRAGPGLLAAQQPWERVLTAPFKREQLVLARRRP